MSHLPATHAIYDHSLTQTINGDTRTKMLFNGLGSRTQQVEAPGLYSTALQKLMPQQQGEIYLLRVEFVATAVTLPLINPTVFMEWDFGPTQNGSLVFGRDVRVMERSTQALPILYNTSAFVGPTFIVNGASFYLTPKDWNVTISSAALTVVRVR